MFKLDVSVGDVLVRRQFGDDYGKWNVIKEVLEAIAFERVRELRRLEQLSRLLRSFLWIIGVH